MILSTVSPSTQQMGSKVLQLLGRYIKVCSSKKWLDSWWWFSSGLSSSLHKWQLLPHMNQTAHHSWLGMLPGPSPSKMVQPWLPKLTPPSQQHSLQGAKESLKAIVCPQLWQPRIRPAWVILFRSSKLPWSPLLQAFQKLLLLLVLDLLPPSLLRGKLCLLLLLWDLQELQEDNLGLII